MSLINDLGTEIAFAFLVEKQHTGKVTSRDVVPLIGRLNEALEEISTKEEKAEQIALDARSAKSMAH